MNLFENIFNPVNSFLGKQVQPQVPVSAPKAPRTASYVEPTTPYVPQTVTKPDVSSQLKQKYGYNDKDIEFLKQAKQKGLDSKGAFDYIAKRKQQDKGILGSDANRQGFVENAVGVGTDIVGGAVSQVPKFLGETASFVTKASQYNPSTYLGNMASDIIKAPFSEKTYGDIRTERANQLESVTGGIEGYGQKGKELVQSTGLYDPNTLSAKGGELVTDIAGSLIGPNKIGILKKGAEVLGVGKKLAMGAKIGDIALEGGLAGAKYDIGTKGDITHESVAMGSVGGLALSSVPKIYQGSKSLAKNIFPKAVEVPVGVSKPVSSIIKKIVPDSFTPTELDNLKRSGQIKSGQGITGSKNTYIPSKEEIQIAEAITPHVKASATTTENISSLRNAIKNEAESLKSAISIQNPIIPKKQVSSHIKSALDKIMENPEMMLGENPKLVNKLLEKYKAILDEEGGTAMGILNARQRFDSYIKNFRPKTFDSPTGGVYDSAVREVRNSANDLLDSLVLNKSAKDSLRLQSQMFKAIDMFARNRDITKVGKLLKSRVGQVIGGAALGSAGVGLITGN